MAKGLLLSADEFVKGNAKRVHAKFKKKFINFKKK